MANASPKEIVVKSLQQAQVLSPQEIQTHCVRIGGGCGELDPEEIVECAKIIGRSGPKALNLCQSYLQNQHWKEIMKNCPDLQDLDYRHNGLESSEAEEFCEIIAQSKLKGLDLDCNNLGVRGVIAFANLLRRNETLENLNLSENICWEQTTPWNETPVHEVGDPAATALADALMENKTLITLKLRNDRISARSGVWAFCNEKIAQQKNGCKRTIDLSRNYVNDDDLGDFHPNSKVNFDEALSIVREINPGLNLVSEED